MTASVKKPGKTPKGTKITKEFQFKLSQGDYESLGKGVGALSQEIQNLATQFEEVKDTWKAKIKAREAKRDDILNVLGAGEEKRTVEAVMEKDFEANEVRFWFEGVTIDRRAMTEQERQVEMDLREKKQKPVSDDEAHKRARGVRQKIEKGPNGQPDPVAAAHAAANGVAFEDLGEVHKLETKRSTKTSAVDGPTRN